MRGRGNGRKGGNPRNQSFESNGPDVKVRGNAQQVVEKYLTLARDASSAGDRINAESYYQFAEHYYRVMNAANEQQRQQQQQQNTEAEGDAQQGGDAAEAADASDNDGNQNNGRRRRNVRGNGRENGTAKEEAADKMETPVEEAAAPAPEAASDEDAGEKASA
ncbi:MAG: DUF4167 domain-containing protein [Alphaproteobacteria bacterium]